ncbi:MAG: hypothetical protein ABI175_27490 [Polyangiales bacterium]
MHLLALLRPPSIDAQAVGSVLARGLRATTQASEGALLVAPVMGEAFVLGAFQRAASTLDLTRPEVVGAALARRATGGVALHVRRGQIFVALELASASVLGGNGDPARAINRHVRPLLSALSASGVPATYGGRDFVVAGGAPVAWVGVTHDRALGSVSLEMLVAVEAPFGIDPALDLAHGSIAPRWLGKTPGTLTTHAHRNVESAAVVDAIFTAWSAVARGETSEAGAPPFEEVPVARDQRPFDALVEEGMGLIGAARDPGALSIGGELMASRGALEALGERLHGLADDAMDLTLEETIDAALGPSSGTMLFGVKSLASIAKVVRATKTLERPAVTRERSRRE